MPTNNPSKKCKKEKKLFQSGTSILTVSVMKEVVLAVIFVTFRPSRSTHLVSVALQEWKSSSTFQCMLWWKVSVVSMVTLFDRNARILTRKFSLNCLHSDINTIQSPYVTKCDDFCDRTRLPRYLTWNEIVKRHFFLCCWNYALLWSYTYQMCWGMEHK